MWNFWQVINFLQIAIAAFYDDDGSNVDPAPPPAPEPVAKPTAELPTGPPKQSATSRYDVCFVTK